jgi:hypothetical protein
MSRVYTSTTRHSQNTLVDTFTSKKESYGNDKVDEKIRRKTKKKRIVCSKVVA